MTDTTFHDLLISEKSEEGLLLEALLHAPVGRTRR